VEHCLFEGEFFLFDSRREEVEISVMDGGGVATGIGGGEECFSKRARSVGATTSGVIASVAGGRSCSRGKNWCDGSAIGGNNSPVVSVWDWGSGSGDSGFNDGVFVVICGIE